MLRQIFISVLLFIFTNLSAQKLDYTADSLMTILKRKLIQLDSSDFIIKTDTLDMYFFEHLVKAIKEGDTVLAKKYENKILKQHQDSYTRYFIAGLKGDTILAKQIENSIITIEPIEEKSFPVRNISEHTFKIPFNQIKDSIVAFFNFENQYKNKFIESIFYYYFPDNDSAKNNKHFVSFNAETKKDSSYFSKSYFSNANTSNDIYLRSYDGWWLSKLYFSKGKPLEYGTSFIIKLSKIDRNSTKVSIVAEDPIVINGIDGFGFHGPRGRETKVQPSSIEEYSLLLFIADKLGDKTLPPLKLPSQK